MTGLLKMRIQKKSLLPPLHMTQRCLGSSRPGLQMPMLAVGNVQYNDQDAAAQEMPASTAESSQVTEQQVWPCLALAARSD